MIQVSVELGGDGGLVTSVRARSIGRAVRLAGALYPGREVRVLFPLEESFFVKAGGPATERVEPAVSAGMAG